MELDEHGNPIVKPLTAEEIAAQVQAKVDEQLKDIKAKLNDAYSARDAANTKAAQLEEQRRAQEMEALTAAGKHTEVANMKIAALEEKLKLAESRITGYTRDHAVRDVMRGLEFRNDRSSEMAYRDVVDALVQNEQGEWVHKTGVAIKDFVASFAKDPENEFLFKPKTNTGSGTGTPTGGTPKLDPNKKLSQMTTEEMLALAGSGALKFK
jgi:hypothetical protein